MLRVCPKFHKELKALKATQHFIATLGHPIFFESGILHEGLFHVITFKVILARSSCRSMMPCTRLRKSLQVGQAQRANGASKEKGRGKKEEHQKGFYTESIQSKIDRNH